MSKMKVKQTIGDTNLKAETSKNIEAGFDLSDEVGKRRSPGSSVQRPTPVKSMI